MMVMMMRMMGMMMRWTEEILHNSESQNVVITGVPQAMNPQLQTPFKTSSSIIRARHGFIDLGAGEATIPE